MALLSRSSLLRSRRHTRGDDAGAVWQFHHTEAFLPFPRASTTPDQGSGRSWGVSRKTGVRDFPSLPPGAHFGMAGIATCFRYQAKRIVHLRLIDAFRLGGRLVWHFASLAVDRNLQPALQRVFSIHAALRSHTRGLQDIYFQKTGMTMKLFQRLFKQAEPCIDLRAGRVDDLKALGGLLQFEAENAHFFGLRTSEEIEGYLAELRSQIETLAEEKPVRVSLISITVDAVPVGYLILMATPDASVMDLNVLVIDPQWRGRGLARFAVNELVSQLAQGDRRMLVRCLPASNIMMSLLQQLGFKEVPTTDLIVRHFMSSTLASEGHV